MLSAHSVHFIHTVEYSVVNVGNIIQRHHHSQDMEHFHHSKNVLVSLCSWSPLLIPNHWQLLITFVSL